MDHALEIRTSHTHHHKSDWKYICMIILNGLFFLIELIFGILIQSLALQADAFHMLSDLMAFLIAYLAEKISIKTSSQATFGFTRAEIVGALVNSIFLISSCFFIGVDAIHRFFDINMVIEHLDENIDSLIIVGSIGLGINLIAMFFFPFHSHSDDLNEHALSLHILGDVMGSVGVVLSGFLIKYLDGKWIYFTDPVVSLFIVFTILKSVYPIAKKCIQTLLHVVPEEINIDEIKGVLEELPGVKAIHHFHVWKQNDKVTIGMLHVVINKKVQSNAIRGHIEQILHQRKIHNTTIQIEQNDREDSECINIKCATKECKKNQCCVND